MTVFFTLLEKYLSKVLTERRQIQKAWLTRISKDFIWKNPAVYRTVLTDAGELYYTTKDISKAGKFDIKTSEGAPWTHKIMDSKYVSSSEMFAVYTKDEQNLIYQVLTSTQGAPTSLIATENEQYSAPSVLEYSQKNTIKITTQSIGETEGDQLVFILSSRQFHVVRYNAKTETRQESNLQVFKDAVDVQKAPPGGGEFQDMVTAYVGPSIYAGLVSRYNITSGQYLLDLFEIVATEGNPSQKHSGRLMRIIPHPSNSSTALRYFNPIFMAKSGIKRDPKVPRTLNMHQDILVANGGSAIMIHLTNTLKEIISL